MPIPCVPSLSLNRSPFFSLFLSLLLYRSFSLSFLLYPAWRLQWEFSPSIPLARNAVTSRFISLAVALNDGVTIVNLPSIPPTQCQRVQQQLPGQTKIFGFAAQRVTCWIFAQTKKHGATTNQRHNGVCVDSEPQTSECHPQMKNEDFCSNSSPCEGGTNDVVDISA